MKKIHEWELWDWKSILIAILVFAGLALFLQISFRAPDLMRNRKGKEYDESVPGKVISYCSSTYLSQGKTGTRTSVLGISITFSYTVNGITYYNSDLIPQSFANQNFLANLYKTPEMDIQVKYAVWNPQLSQIQMKPMKPGSATQFHGIHPPQVYPLRPADSL